MRTTRDTRDAGMVTAEAAVVLPTLVLLLALAVTVVTTVGAQLKLVDAARESARAAARGEDVATVKRAGQQTGPSGTAVEVVRTGRIVRVTARATTKPLGLLPGLHLTAQAITESEERTTAGTAQR